MEKTRKIITMAVLTLITFWVTACAGSGEQPVIAKNPAEPLLNKDTEKTDRMTQLDKYFSDSNQLTTLEAVKLSKWIVLVKTTSSEVREMPDKNIFTFSNFEVLESIKENYSDKNLTLRIVGGQFNGVDVTKPFNLEFEKNRKYVLFLGKKNAFGYPTINPQSIFMVEIDRETNLEVISPKPSLTLYNAKSGELYAKKPNQISLADFLYSIKRVK